MPAPTVTYTFTNGTAADATQVNTNFTDVINGITDGTKDLSISALTAAGATALNGNITLGNASGDTLTINASLSSSLPIATTRTYDIGSADLGLRVLYLGGNDAHTIAFQAPSSGMSADYSLSLPAVAPAVGKKLVASSTSALVWAPGQYDINAVSSADYTVTDTDGYRLILVTTGSSNRTVTLPTAADNTDREIVIMKADSGTGTVIVDGESTETIDGAATQTLFKQYESITVVCDGTGWYISQAKWAAGTYTPTITDSTNVAASTSYQAQYSRVGNVVTVAGKVDIDTTSGSTLSEIGISLPIASNFADNSDCAGTSIGLIGGGAAGDQMPGQIFGDATNDRATLNFNSYDTGNRTHRFMFQYEII